MSEATVFFSASTALFYDTNIYGAQLPADAVEITDDLRESLLEAQSLGRQIVADKNGKPMAIERPAPTFEQQVERERFWRDSLLTRTDALVTRYRDEQDSGLMPSLTVEQYRQMQAYRFELRNWPASPNFPSILHRPLAPEWLSSLTP
ncbi:phage tail assembly chaperone [Pseudomonas piscis]|uniref:Phage tail assembly chaperone n=1 Tax=Pseudomonas piscis TaxID=2614538 RepID=A0ABY9NA32_9PSED|nr:phage tail assembly chaperone [Pseudomonas piscis]WMN15354.1 phage tail assembly chaperone [Pseudomonas piscis]